MEILIISELWWPEGGGGILASHLIAKILRDMGFKLTVVHGIERPEALKGIDYVYTCLLSARVKHRFWLSCLLLTKQPWFQDLVHECDIVYIPRLAYPVIPLAKKQRKKVVVHLHDLQPISYNAVVLHNSGRRSRLAAVRDLVEFEMGEHGSIGRAMLSAVSPPINLLSKRWVSEADMVICVSRRQAEMVRSAAPELARKLRVIYNPPPDLPMIEKRLEEPYIMYLGGDSCIKGFHVFLKASQEILRRGDAVKFLLAGKFRERSRLIVEALNRRFRGAYSLLGYLKHEEVLRLHSVSYAFLFPSICEEPLPYAVVESMLAGTIPIASRVGGVPEIVEGTYAENFLCDPYDIDCFVDRMEQVLGLRSEEVRDIGLSLRGSIIKKFDGSYWSKKLVEAFLS